MSGRYGSVSSSATTYWYFADKDDVLIAVPDAVMADIWPQYQDVANEPIPARLLWVVRQLHQMSRLVTTVHARVEHSTAVAEWHRNFHLLTGGLFRVELKNAGVATLTVEAEVMIGIFTIEGLLMHPMSDEEQRTICHALAERWSPGRVRRPVEIEKDPTEITSQGLALERRESGWRDSNPRPLRPER